MKTPKRRGRKPKAAAVEEVKRQQRLRHQRRPSAWRRSVAQAAADTSEEDQGDSQCRSDAAREDGQQERERGKFPAREGFQSEEVTDEEVWEGDPGDGTDFITIVDIPIEDNQAIPTLDMFDRPTAQQQADAEVNYPKEQNTPKYDFEDFITGNGVLECLTDGYGFLRSSDVQLPVVAR